MQNSAVSFKIKLYSQNKKQNNKKTVQNPSYAQNGVVLSSFRVFTTKNIALLKSENLFSFSVNKLKGRILPRRLCV